MKALAIAVATIWFLVSAIYSGTTAWHVNQDLQYLSLADDASTPAKKSEYIGKFLSQMSRDSLPEYSAFIFKHERNRVANQVDVLLSLQKRCDDLAKVDPSSLGYATGMQQISGQEFDHALANVSSVFEDAMFVRAGAYACYGWIISGLIAVVVIVCVVVSEGY